MINLKQFVVGPLETNAYLVINSVNSAFLIDPAGGYKLISDYLETNEINLKFIILTHGHFDHIETAELFNLPIYIHQADQQLLTDPTLNGSEFFGSPLILDSSNLKIITIDSEINFDSSQIKVIHTPGHTAGGISLNIDQYLFTGDTLFYHSIGRTDLVTGNYDTIIASIRNKLFLCDPESIVFPGHGRKSTIKEEKKNNPFLKNS